MTIDDALPVNTWRPWNGRNDARSCARLKTLAERYPKYGCPTLHDMLVIEGEVVTKKRKMITRPRVPMLVPNPVIQRSSIDLISD